MIREQKEQRERRCPSCGRGTLVARVIRDEFEYGPEEDRITIVAEGVPVLECPACGETLYGPDAARARHQAICRTLGLLTPEQIRGVREKLGKKQAEFAELTGIGVATLSRWEQGRLIQTRALDRYLRLLRWEENAQRLRDLQEGTNGMSPTSFTMEDFNRQYIKEHFAQLTPEEQEEVLRALPPEERLAGLSAEQIRQYLARLSPERPAAPRKPRRKK